MTGLSAPDLRGQPLAISLAVVNFPFITAIIGVGLLMIVVGGVGCVLRVCNVVDGLTHGKPFLVKSASNKACNTTPFAFRLWERGGANGRSLRVALVPTSRILTRSGICRARSQRVGVLLVWTST